jgi:hypothetical protein
MTMIICALSPLDNSLLAQFTGQQKSNPFGLLPRHLVCGEDQRYLTAGTSTCRGPK